MKVWITKDALTKGIEERNAEHCWPTMIDCGRMQYFHKPDWHTSKEEAVAHAEQMRESQVKSLQNGLEKLENMRFT